MVKLLQMLYEIAANLRTYLNECYTLIYSGRLNRGRCMHNSQSEAMHVMVLHKDGFTVSGLNLAIFI
jgi:hypothetical protein